MMEILLLCLVVFIVIFLLYGPLPTLIFRIKNKQLTKKRKSQTDKVIYLTFDDGVDAKYTDELLSLLKKYNVKATFFVVAQAAEQNPQIVENIKQNGHLLALHSLAHKNQILQLPVQTRYDFEKSLQILEESQVKIQFFRPPWGHFSLSTIKQIKQKNLKVVLWSAIVQDWRAKQTSKETAQKLFAKVGAGDIVCLHDGRGKNDAPKRTIQALSVVLPIWCEQGYSFETVEKLCKEI